MNECATEDCRLQGLHHLDHDALWYCQGCAINRLSELVSKLFTGYVRTSAELVFED
ncbi:unnamed protein product [marine sediment metagenome]|uniref:Uncharacterized protein n=1 Tax=marine sediment metagenome TaxID=412755 RepID=X0SSB4_9ZZZZ